MDTKPEYLRVASYGIVTRSNEVLLCRCSSTLPEAGYWTLPGGGIEFGEHPEAAMIREVQEETGLTVEPEGIAGVNSISGEEPTRHFHGIRIVYFTSIVGGNLRYEVGGSTDMCQWHEIRSLEQLPLLKLVQWSLPYMKNSLDLEK